MTAGTKFGERLLAKQFCALLVLLAMTACSHVKSGRLHHANLTLYSFQDGEASAQQVPVGSTIPYSTSSCYGWILRFDPVDSQVAIDELLLLPDPANHWGVTPGSVVADDKRSARTRIVVSGQLGQAEQSWCVAAGDPEGQYKFVITRGKTKVGELPFVLSR